VEDPCVPRRAKNIWWTHTPWGGFWTHTKGPGYLLNSPGPKRAPCCEHPRVWGFLGLTITPEKRGVGPLGGEPPGPRSGGTNLTRTKGWPPLANQAGPKSLGGTYLPRKQGVGPLWVETYPGFQSSLGGP